MGQIILDKLYMGGDSVDRMYIGGELLYDNFYKNVTFHMPTYNGGMPKVNTFGITEFTGGTEVDGWIGYNPNGVAIQEMRIIPYAISLKNNFLITFVAKWTPGSMAINLLSLSVNSDKTYTNEGNTQNQLIGMYLGTDDSTYDTVSFSKNMKNFNSVRFSDSDRLFKLGCYIDVSSKRCYIGTYDERWSELYMGDVSTSAKYLEYTETIYLSFAFSVFGHISSLNHYKDILIKNIDSVDLNTGKIKYL